MFCVRCHYASMPTFNGGLTHWGRVTHICVGKLTIIGSDNGLSPGRRQAIIWTNAGILIIEPLGTNFSDILIGIQIFSFKKMRLKMSSAKWRLFCLGLNVLIKLPLKLALGWVLIPTLLCRFCWPNPDAGLANPVRKDKFQSVIEPMQFYN